MLYKIELNLAVYFECVNFMFEENWDVLHYLCHSELSNFWFVHMVNILLFPALDEIPDLKDQVDISITFLCWQQKRKQGCQGLKWVGDNIDQITKRNTGTIWDSLGHSRVNWVEWRTQALHHYPWQERKSQLFFIQ